MITKRDFILRGSYFDKSKLDSFSYVLSGVVKYICIAITLSRDTILMYYISIRNGCPLLEACALVVDMCAGLLEQSNIPVATKYT